MLFTTTLAKIAAVVALTSQVAMAYPSSGKPVNVRSQAVTYHNKYRTRHHVPKIKWSQKLAAHAKTVSDTCVWGHNVVSWTSFCAKYTD
jgi:pathogenesis-related protein 1